jgi:hypothetical protein
MKIVDRSVVVAMLLAALAVGLWAPPAWAGGGPENVAVAVNADSWASLAVANEFIHLRHIPPNNVIYLNLGEVADYSTVDVNYFRDKILKPVFDALHERKISSQIDCLVYSTDLPNAVDATPDLAGRKMPTVITQPSSVTGLTYLYRKVLAKNPEYLGFWSDTSPNTTINPSVNRYARQPVGPDTLDLLNQRLLMKVKQLMDQGEYDTAEKLLADMLKKRPRTIRILYDHACVLAHLGKADLAMADLTKAVNEGFVDAKYVAADDDLKPLADRDDFKNLLNRMRELATKPSRPRNADNTSLSTQPTMGFRASQIWNSAGELDPMNMGESYLLSTMLAWTSGRGNSVREALDCLRRSAKADGTFPDGTVYYILNTDVRSKTREWGFASCLERLKELKVKAEIFKTDGAGFPEKKSVAGMMAGSSDFNFTPCGSTIQPGAIAEHLTSFGGNLNEECGQTAMTDWIRAGASGTSGAVTEPYAIQHKFPMPFIHVHYAKGCSLAEAFYQSLMGPYQLLILGDPLCRPWARIPDVQLAGARDGDTVKGTVTLTPSVKEPRATPIGQWELFVDGKRQSVTAAGEMLTLDTTDLSDGYHDVRVVGITSDPIQTQGEARLTLVFNNHNLTAESKVVGDSAVPYGQTVKVQAKAPGAKSIMLTHNGRSVATVDGASGTFEVDTRVLGAGIVTLQAIGILDAKPDPSSLVYCPPVELIVQPPPPLAALKIDESKLIAGGQFNQLGGILKTVQDKVRGDWVSKAAIKPDKDVRLMGYVTATDDDMYQFQVLSDGPCELTLDTQKLKPAGQGKGWQFFPVNLKTGVHFLMVRFTTGPNRIMNIRFGGKGTQTLGPQNFRHMPG